MVPARTPGSGETKGINLLRRHTANVFVDIRSVHVSQRIPLCPPVQWVSELAAGASVLRVVLEEIFVEEHVVSFTNPRCNGGQNSDKRLCLALWAVNRAGFVGGALGARLRRSIQDVDGDFEHHP